MRRQPIARDEVRVGSVILTLPLDSVREDKWGDLEPIPNLWAPLVRALNRKLNQNWKADAGRRQAMRMALGISKLREAGTDPRTLASTMGC